MVSQLVVKILKLWPKRWIVTAFVMLCILYLTLVPRPLPDNDIDIPGLDKVVHAVMFGALAFAGCIDYAKRSRGYSLPGRRVAAWTAVASTVAGGVIEILQMWMGAGRSGDILDFVADATGACLGTWLACRLLRAWVKQNEPSGR